MTATIVRTNETDWLLASLLAEDKFQALTYSATEKMVGMFRGELEIPSSPRTVLEVAQKLAKIPGADSMGRLCEALVGYPELVVKLIPMVIAAEKWTPQRSMIFFVGNQILYGIEQIIERGECLLEKYHLPTQTGDKINSQFNTALKEALSGIDQSRRTCTGCINFIDAYERYQISVLEAEGGICRG
jgi:hypothetical protein